MKPAIIIAETDLRIDRCDKDGEILEARARAGDKVDELGDHAYDALMYCKGADRKSMNYSAWLKQRHYLDKITTKK